MGWIQKAKCDGPGCGVEKKEGNHWLEAMFRTPDGQGTPYLEIQVWARGDSRPVEDAARQGLECFCGHPCLLRLIGELLGEAETVEAKS